MSDNFLRIIPGIPTYTPSADAAQAAETRFRGLLPGADLVAARKGIEVEFVDCGANLERVLCPGCDRDLLADDTWQGLMDKAWEARFSELAVIMPCCGLSTSLNDLTYDWPCGFASYVLEARNPGRILSASEAEGISVALGCTVRVVWSHI